MLISTIKKAIRSSRGKLELYRDLFNLAKSRGDYVLSLEVRGLIDRDIKFWDDAKGFYDLVGECLKFESPVYFDSYLQYLEWRRDLDRRFYLPRRASLLPVVSQLQRLADGELDELFISMPPRVGKTTLVLFFMTWILGRDSELSNLYSAFSGLITGAFYDGVLEVISDSDTYTWGEMFAGKSIASTNGKEETLNIDRRKRYASLTCRSLYGTLNGACDCSGYLISDDLIGGIEEALSVDRLQGAWYKVSNNLLPRAKEVAKKLWIGTRWSVADPIGRRLDVLENDVSFKNHRWEVISVPALDGDGCSNFDFDYGVGFSTEYYSQVRAGFERDGDLASWAAQYMCEPIEREGTLFRSDDMNYYSGELPDGEHRVVMAVDPAFGGGDYLAAVVGVETEDGRVFVHDALFSNEERAFTQPALAGMIQRYGVGEVFIEANRSTESYKDKVEERTRELGLRVLYTTRAASNKQSKEVRIFERAGQIREFYFRDVGSRSVEYGQFLNNVFSFKVLGRNKHDDAPDALAMLADLLFGKVERVRVLPRLW